MKRQSDVDGWIDLVHSHQAFAIAIAVGLVVFAYFKPKLVFKLAGGIGIIIAVAYVISFLANLTSSGIQETTKLTDRPDVRIK